MAFDWSQIGKQAAEAMGFAANDLPETFKQAPTPESQPNTEPANEPFIPANVKGYEDLDIWKKDDQGNYFTFEKDGNRYAYYKDEINPFDVNMYSGNISAWDPDNPGSQAETDYLWAIFPELYKQGLINDENAKDLDWVNFQQMGSDARGSWDPILTGAGYGDEDWRDPYAKAVADQLAWVKDADRYWGDNGEFDIDKYWDYKNGLNMLDWSQWDDFDRGSLVGQDLSGKDLDRWVGVLTEKGWRPYVENFYEDEGLYRDAISGIFDEIKDMGGGNLFPENPTDADYQDLFKTMEQQALEDGDTERAAILAMLGDTGGVADYISGKGGMYEKFADDDQLKRIIAQNLAMSVLDQGNRYIDDNRDLSVNQANSILNRYTPDMGIFKYDESYDGSGEDNSLGGFTRPRYSMDDRINARKWMLENDIDSLSDMYYPSSIKRDSPRMRYVSYDELLPNQKKATDYNGYLG